jgi:16S rRNA (cytosine967-C5)-methyltransferase
MKNRGEITALDINKNKSETIQRLSDRLGITIIKSQVADATKDIGGNYHGKFDKVLVDAPCSGIGTLRRNPEIKWRIQEKDLKSFPVLQKKILNRSAGYPKRGGMIIYTTCTIETEENEEVVKDFLATHPEYECINPPEIISPDLIDNSGFFRTYPHRHGTDGFFGAVLLKR